MFVLRRRLEVFRWFGIFFVIGGLTTVGVCDLIYPKNNHNDTGKQLEDIRSTFPKNDVHLFEGDDIWLHKRQFGEDDHSTSDILLGDILIICAQVNMVTRAVF